MISRKFFIGIVFIFMMAFSALTCPNAVFANFKTDFEQLDIISIENFGKVDNCFYRGGQPDNEDINTLARLGIKTIINLREPNDPEGLIEQKSIANKLGINYINIPMRPWLPPNNSQLNDFFKIIDNPKNLPVFIHCQYGKDRTGIMTALYRVKNYCWTFEQAYTEMRYYGYHRLLFPRQKRFLKDFSELIQKNRIINS